MKTAETVKTVAKGVQDFSNGQDGSKTVDVPYEFSYTPYETIDEVRKDYSESDLVSLANQREKSSGNAAARTKAIAQYAIDPNSKPAIRDRMIKDAVKLGKTKEQAEAFVDSLLAA